jgi:hypothetical protein
LMGSRRIRCWKTCSNDSCACLEKRRVEIRTLLVRRPPRGHGLLGMSQTLAVKMLNKESRRRHRIKPPKSFRHAASPKSTGPLLLPAHWPNFFGQSLNLQDMTTACREERVT